MKTFNQTISIEVEVDSIAAKMLDSIVESNPHRELIVETVIGSMLKSGHMTMVYNALNGYTNDLNFQIGQPVVSKQTYYGYKLEDEEWVQRSLPIEGKIKEIDTFKERNVLVEIEGCDRSGQPKLYTEWTRHTHLEQ